MGLFRIGGTRPLGGLFALVALLVLVGSVLATAPTASAVVLPYSADSVMRFEANQGQFEAGVDYVSRGQGYQVYLTKPGAVIVLQTTPSRREALARAPQVRAEDAERSKTVVRMNLLGARSQPEGVGDQPAGTANYLL